MKCERNNHSLKDGNYYRCLDCGKYHDVVSDSEYGIV